MANLLSREEIHEQSVRAHTRWKSLWEENAKNNAANYIQSLPINGSGMNRKAIVVSYGPSLQENLDAIKEKNLHYEYDIICIDKSLKTCLSNGIIPKYCVISDAQVSFEEYGDIPNVRQISLISAVTANWKWSNHWVKNGGNVYLYLNKDHIRTHRIYGEYLGPGKTAFIIPASSNVGNAAYVITTLVLGYRQVLMAAYNYSFELFGQYYGDKTGKEKDINLGFDKHTFYNHYTMVGIDGKLVQCSHNMQFSAKWLIGYIDDVARKQGIETINITGKGILRIQNQAKIRREAA